MEPQGGPTHLQEVEAGLAGLSLSNSNLPPKNSHLDPPKLPPRPPSANTKRRLATTRGFGNSVASDVVTPENTPSKFSPQLRSTPLVEAYPLGASSHPLPSPRVIQLNPTLAPGVSEPCTAARPSVISPRITVSQASLDWDSYSESPSYNPGSQGVEANQLNISSCVREIQGITGLEEIPKITLVDTSVSSLSASSSSSQSSQVHHEFTAK